MQIRNCFKGQRVIYKENGKVATILSVSHNKGEILIAFDNAERAKVGPHLLEPATEQDASGEKSGGPRRPCPQCGEKMPVDEKVCPACGFQYGVKKRSAFGRIVKKLLTVVVLLAIAYAVWKYVLQR